MFVQWQKRKANVTLIGTLLYKYIYSAEVLYTMPIAGYCVFLYGGRDFLICISLPVMRLLEK